MTDKIAIAFTINGAEHQGKVEPRMLLVDYIRQEIGLTGTHVGCEHGVCGACTILLDGQAVRSCIMLAVQADEQSLETVESLASSEDQLHPIQEGFWEAHGLQCGFCTPGFLMTLKPYLEENPDPSEEEIREALSGNICRCTGYQHIVDAVQIAAKKMQAAT